MLLWIVICEDGGWVKYRNYIKFNVTNIVVLSLFNSVKQWRFHGISQLIETEYAHPLFECKDYIQHCNIADCIIWRWFKLNRNVQDSCNVKIILLNIL